VYKSLTTSVVVLALATSAFADEPKETKPIAKLVQLVPCRAPIPGPVQDWNGAEGVVVIRSGEELVARSATPEQAKDRRAGAVRSVSAVLCGSGAGSPRQGRSQDRDPRREAGQKVNVRVTTKNTKEHKGKQRRKRKHRPSLVPKLFWERGGCGFP
jgi:hypothetical protein